MRPSGPIVLCLVLAFLAASSAVPFRLATSYGSHMVFQRERNNTVWGFGSRSAPVNVVMGPVKTSTVVGDDGRWSVQLYSDKIGPYDITFQSNKESVVLKDVLFGQVWLCSGQSNMRMTLEQTDRAAEFIADSKNYPVIRYTTVAATESKVPLEEAKAWSQRWSVAGPDTIRLPRAEGEEEGQNEEWEYMSATCWHFARSLYQHLQEPIGLLSTSYSGTRVEAWSSPDALAKCAQYDDERSQADSNRLPALPRDPNDPSVLWNAHIVPLLRHTIKGAIWYQGESNVKTPNYECKFVAMVNDWRLKWFKATNGATELDFPFGFVQLSTWDSPGEGVAQLRWQQTTGHGYVPNAQQPRYFMAVAMDLGESPKKLDIHPKNKHDVGFRLAQGAWDIAYGHKDTYWTGPLPAKVEKVNERTVLVSFRSAAFLQLKNADGFELYDGSKWYPAKAKSAGNNAVYVESTVAPSSKLTAVRYAWKTVPCDQLKCAVYGVSGDFAFPAPPFVMNFTI